MIDLHCHLLPNLSDGPTDLADCEAMLQQAAAAGVNRIVAVAHFQLSEASSAEELLAQALAKLAEPARRSGIALSDSWEYDYGDLDQAKPLHPLADGCNYVLIDFNCSSLPVSAEAYFFELERAGYRAVIVHPERLFGEIALPRLTALADQGAVIQINASSLLPEASAAERRMADLLIRSGVAQVVASDAHRPHGRRRSRLAEAQEYCRKRYSEKKADLLFEINPRRILENQPPIRLLPIPGLWQRISSLWSRRGR